MASGLTIHRKRGFHLWSWVFWIVLIGLIGLVGWAIYRYFTTGELPPVLAVKALTADPRVDESPVSQQQITAYTVPGDQPRYVTVPALGIAPNRVFPVGITANQEVAMPKNIVDAGWYTKSAEPGQGYGVVVLDGHSKGIAKNGIFAKLGSLPGGATISIERGDGRKFTYAVVSVTTMTLSQFAKMGAKEMMLPLEPAKEGLSILTNAGRWVPKYKEFDQRTLVRAVRM